MLNYLKLQLKIKYYALFLMLDFEIFEGRSENKFKTYILRCLTFNTNSVCISEVTETEL